MKRSKVKTHTFRMGTYDINLCGAIDGTCDVPTKKGERLQINILDNGDFRSLNAALHEALHASGVPDKYLHGKGGYSSTEPIAMFLWRLGYRIK